MTTYVLDASAGAALLLDTADGRSILGQLQSGAQWWVPEHYFVEVASVLRRAELSGIINSANADSRVGASFADCRAAPPRSDQATSGRGLVEARTPHCLRRPVRRAGRTPERDASDVGSTAWEVAPSTPSLIEPGWRC